MWVRSTTGTEAEDGPGATSDMNMLTSGPTLARVDAHALRVLEFPAFAERLAAATSTPLGSELALALVPSGDPGEVAQRQALTAEAIGLLDESAEPELAGIEDVRDATAHAARDGVLGPRELRAVATT